MASITINEISQNYTYNIGTNSFATVALPITSCWGPAFTNDIAGFSALEPGDDSKYIIDGDKIDEMLDGTVWYRYPATQAGLEAFVSAYRGPASNYRLAKDYSYQMAMTLLTSGYDVLVCRLCPGTVAENKFTINAGQLGVQAKYPGTFGNQLRVRLTRGTTPVNYKRDDNGEILLGEGGKPEEAYYSWNLITYVVDSSGVQTAVENLAFVFDENNSTDTLLNVREIESSFVTLTPSGTLSDAISDKPTEEYILLTGGTDKEADAEVSEMLEAAVKYATIRYNAVGYDAETSQYIQALSSRSGSNTDAVTAATFRYNEWLYTSAYFVYDLIKDKLSYNPQRIISPGWDDQNIKWVRDLEFTQLDKSERINDISPLHIKLMETAYYSRCGTAMLDIPKSEPRNQVYNDSYQTEQEGYAQKLARYQSKNAVYDENASLYHTHSALFAPWRKYTYVGTAKQNPAPPSFLALLIHRAMLLNQSIQYEWALPTNRTHNLNIGTPDYTVGKKLLDTWQTLEGVGVNVITEVPDLGTTIWGNSTLYEVPPATYQALANLSTRYLVNAVEDVIYKCGISITFQYNNDQAYNKFYAGVTPICSTMKNVGAITDYYIKMSADINGLDQVNANTVIGKVYLVIEGVINDIAVDLIALPPGTDLDQYRS